MAMTITDFWRLMIESQLASSDQCQKIAARFAQSKQSANATPKKLADWLRGSQGVEQLPAMVLLAGHPGPFHYGEYRVSERIESGRLAGNFRAAH